MGSFWAVSHELGGIGQRIGQREVTQHPRAQEVLDLAEMGLSERAILEIIPLTVEAVRAILRERSDRPIRREPVEEPTIDATEYTAPRTRPYAIRREGDVPDSHGPVRVIFSRG